MNDPDNFWEPLGWADPGLGPAVQITSPLPGAEVAGETLIVVEVEATESRTIESVEFFVDEGLIGPGIEVSDGWSFSWDTTTSYPDGFHTITVVATDSANDIGKSSIEVYVNNVMDGTMTVQLVGDSREVNRNFWDAIVTVTVVPNDSPPATLAGATVHAYWDDSFTTNLVSGETDESGNAVFEMRNLRSRSVPSITFTVTDVVWEGYTFASEPVAITLNAPVSSRSLYNDLAIWQVIKEDGADQTEEGDLGAALVDYYFMMAYGV
ncbi:MAG: hypothetical protein GX616_09180 [Planctomycetes bacterium]|nr:hypothetical protein [Planctomycetota bacterium]